MEFIHKQTDMFIKYCKANPIDAYIINQLDKSTLNEFRYCSHISVSNTDIYVSFETIKHLYLFKFKDIDAYTLYVSLLNLNPAKIRPSFKYGEYDIKINGIDLKYTILHTESYANVYTFDEQQRVVMVTTAKDIMVCRDIKSILPNFVLKPSHDIFEFIHEQDMPDELRHVVTVQKVLMSLS